MTHVFLERQFETPIDLDDVRQMAIDNSNCIGIYGVEWHQSHLAKDGSRLYCHFEAPDTEAMRNVLRFNHSEYNAVWPSEIHDTGNDGEVNVLVERSWDEPVTIADIAAIEKEGAWCLEAHNVTFLKTYFASDHKRMICLYRAPDAESVRQSQIKANMPFDDVWSFTLVTPATLFPDGF